MIALVAAGTSTAWAQGITVSSPDGRRQSPPSRATGPITIDGALDEPVWSHGAPGRRVSFRPIPRRQPATEDTEVRIAFDDDNLYIARALPRQRCRRRIVVNDIRKDFAGREQDTFEVLLDTFADRRNGFVFVTNAAGAKADTQIANEGREINPNWDAVWWVEARRTSDGWTAEFRIPFKTLRFRAAARLATGASTSRAA